MLLLRLGVREISDCSLGLEMFCELKTFTFVTWTTGIGVGRRVGIRLFNKFRGLGGSAIVCDCDDIY